MTRIRGAMWTKHRVYIPIAGVFLFLGGLAHPERGRTVGPEVPARIFQGTALRQEGQTPAPAPSTSGEGSIFSGRLEEVWQTVRDRFYDKNLNGVDWKRIGETYRSRLAAVKTRPEFAALVNQMLGELHASHTQYVTDDDMEYYMLPAVMSGDLQGHQVENIGVMGQRAGGEYVVTAVMDGSPAEQAGIHSGDHLLTADGKPFTSAGSFHGKEGESVRVTLRREGENTPRTVTVTPVRQNILRAFLEATRKSARILDVQGKKIGYVHLWTMAHPSFHDALDRLVTTKLHDTDGLLLDLRDGYGGMPFGYEDVFSHPDIAWEQQGHGSEPSVQHLGYGKPMVVLINGGTRSAKEFLTYQLKVSHRATIVGSRTAGAFLGANIFPVGKDGLVELAVEGLRLDGKLLEGVGVSPDVPVESHASYTDRDPQMARAEQVLLKVISQQMAQGASLPSFGAP